jgi:hypothetical protein
MSEKEGKQSSKLSSAAVFIYTKSKYDESVNAGRVTQITNMESVVPPTSN